MRKIILLTLATCSAGISYSQTKLGANATNINNNAVLEMESANQGVLLPRVALTGTTAAAPLSAFTAGMVVYNTATAGTTPNNVVPGLYISDGTKWVRLLPESAVVTGGYWGSSGNSGTSTSNFIGTTDSKDLIFKTNNTERFRVTKAGGLYGGNSNSYMPDTASYGIAWGNKNLATRNYSTAIGNTDTATGTGNGAWAIGYRATATGDRAVAIGSGTTASATYSNAFGYNSSASGNYAGAWGNTDTAVGTGTGAWAIGTNNKAIGSNTIAMGTNAAANSNYSTAIGYAPAANGTYTVAMGNNTAANAYNMTAAGVYNAIDSTASGTTTVAKDPLFTIGNGTSTTRGNALNVVKSGQVLISTSTSGITGYAAPRADLDIRGTGGVIWPVGTTANRPTSPVPGMVRFNTDSRKFEGFDGTAWFNMN